MKQKTIMILVGIAAALQTVSVLFAVLMTVPLWVGTKETIAPLWLEFFLFGMGFYLTAVFLGKHRDLEFAGERGKGRKFFDCIRPVLLGLFTAFVIYAGPFGILLTALGLSVLWINCKI